MSRLTIIQPYIPAYRVPFFAELITTLSTNGIECRILAGAPMRDQARRRDAAAPDWLLPIQQREVTVGDRVLRLGSGSSQWSGEDGVILGHVGSSLDVYRAIYQRHQRHRIRVGLWGHVKSYAFRANPLDLALERWQLRHVDHVFAYTPSGAEYAIASGAPPGTVTTVMNTVDTANLAKEKSLCTTEDVAAFRKQWHLGDGPILAYCGGLDENKRISFFAEALDRLWEADSSICVVVAGKGASEDRLDDAEARGQVKRVGHADAAMLAKIAASSRGFLNPGPIGLLAVDALVLGRTILTTDIPFHGPERDYLEEGKHVITAEDCVDSYAAAAMALAHRPEWDLGAAAYPRLAEMVERFAGGVQAMLA